MTNALVLSGMENLALSVIRTLGGKGATVTVGGAGKGSLLRLSRHCARFEAVAPDAATMAAASDAVVEAAAALARSCGATVVVPADVAAGLLAARLKERLPGVSFFPSPAPDTLRLMDNKWSFYGFLVAHGLPSPATRLVERPSEEAATAGPCVIKPLADSGGRGVRVLLDAAAARAALAETPGPVLVQDLVHGEDVDLSFLAKDGDLIAWSVQIRRADGAIVYIEDARVLEIGRAIAKASKYTGLAHIDMRYDGPARAKVLVIECNPRFWGSFQYTLGLGVDFLGLGLELAAGRTPKPLSVSPTGECPGLMAVLRGALKGRFSVPPGTRVYLRQKLSDPGPELRKAARGLVGLREDGP